MPPKVDAMARVYLYPTEEGGRTQPLVLPWRGCPVLIDEVDDGFHDCFFWINDVAPVFPGQTATLPIAFLSPHLFADKLVLGRKFKMWELRIIGEGEITEVFYKLEGKVLP